MKTQEEVKITGKLLAVLDQAEKLIAQGSDVSIDFRNCTFVSVEGLEWLEEILLRAKSGSHKVAFVNIPPAIYKVFKVAKNADILEACGALALSGPVC